MSAEGIYILNNLATPLGRLPYLFGCFLLCLLGQLFGLNSSVVSCFLVCPGIFGLVLDRLLFIFFISNLTGAIFSVTVTPIGMLLIDNARQSLKGASCSLTVAPGLGTF